MKGAIIVAGGTSQRFGADKLNLPLMGKTVLQHSVDLFLSIADFVVVVGKHVPGAIYAPAGQTRFASVANGIKAMDKRCTLVAIHDGARPFVTRQLAQHLFDQATLHNSAVPRLSVTDTVWQTDGQSVAKADRSALFTVQTPQVFNFAMLQNALQNANDNYTDESTLFFDTYGSVNFVEGQRSNVKLTYADDLPTFSVGAGFDVHPFTEGNGVVLGGVTIPYCKKLKGHSDADALCHAICDGILSASGNKDIGHQFPDTDVAYKGIDSTILLEKCVRLACQGGWWTHSVSAVIICQQPKIAPYIDDMRAKLASILQVDVGCVSISATTTEKLGALGNGDGIAVQAQVLLRK